MATMTLFSADFELFSTQKKSRGKLKSSFEPSLEDNSQVVEQHKVVVVVVGHEKLHPHQLTRVWMQVHLY